MRKTQSFHEVLKSWMHKSGKKDLYYELRIKETWKELLGERIYSKTKSINWAYQDQILLVKIADPLLKNELQFAKEAIREKINQSVEEIEIQKIIIM